jgi:hypothetical protein
MSGVPQKEYAASLSAAGRRIARFATNPTAEVRVTGPKIRFNVIVLNTEYAKGVPKDECRVLRRKWVLLRLFKPDSSLQNCQFDA